MSTHTGSDPLVLVEACEAHVEAYLDFVRECLPVEDNPFMRRRFQEWLRHPPAALARERDYAHGRNLSDGFVPETIYWLVRDGERVLARSSLRHQLTPHLEREGGHIGYSVRPSERGKGYGTAVCRLTLARARALGLRRVLITCDADNAASARIIEKNGGVLEDQRRSVQTGKMKRRYWVKLET